MAELFASNHQKTCLYFPFISRRPYSSDRLPASGRPVIAGANSGSEVYNVLKDHGCGIVVKPEDPKQMSDAVIVLYKDRVLAEEYGKKGREFAVNHLQCSGQKSKRALKAGTQRNLT